MTQFSPSSARSSTRYSSRDVLAITYVSDAVRRLGLEPNFAPVGDPLQSPQGDVVAIGGWAGNQTTLFALTRYCPGFRLVTNPAHDEPLPLREADMDSLDGQMKAAYVCGSHRFELNHPDGYGFVVRLEKDVTGIPSTILLLWGHTGLETCAAAHALTEHAGAFVGSSRSVFYAVSVAKPIGHRSIGLPPIDLTDSAFNSPTSA